MCFCESNFKQRLRTDTAFTGRFLKHIWRMFTARYELNMAKRPPDMEGS